MRAFLLLIAVVGTLLFGSLFALSLASPVTVERWARDAIEHEVEARVGKELRALSQSSLVQRAQALIARHRQESAFDRKVVDFIHDRVEQTTTQMLEPGCTCRQRLAMWIKEGAESHIQWLRALDSHLTELIESKYAQVSQALVREVRIFSAANLFVFVLLGLLAFFRRNADRLLLVPAFILLASTSVTAYFYLFQQNWLQTILLGDYVGFWYFGYLGIVAAFLADISLNKCRITSLLMNAIGAVVPVAPC